MSSEVIPFLSDEDMALLRQRFAPVGEQFSMGRPVSESRFFVYPTDPGVPYRHWDVRRDVNFGAQAPDAQMDPFDIYDTYHLDIGRDRRFHATAGECLAWLRRHLPAEILNSSTRLAYMPLRDSMVDPFMIQFRLQQTDRPSIPGYVAGRLLVWIRT